MHENLLDRMIGFFSPAAEARRLRARAALGYYRRNYEGATKGRRTKNWSATNAAVNAIISGGITTLRARSRDLVRNNPYAAKAVGVITSNTVGRGIIPQARSADAGLAARFDDLWIAWGDETLCDADDRLDFYGLQALVMRTVAEAGSCLVRRRRRLASDGLPVPMQLQILEPDFLDMTRDRVLPNGGQIIHGVEFDPLGRRAAYWLFQDHPGNRVMGIGGLQSRRVSADDVLHVFRLERAGQVDGIPWGAPCVLRLKDLDEYEDAQLIRQKIAACFAGFVHDIEAMDDLSTNAEKKDALERFEPGMIEHLPPGKDITLASPPPAEGFGEYTAQVLRSIAAGYGVTYEALTGDYSQVNFSSGRMGWIEMQRNLDQWRDHMLVPQLCKGVWRWFVEAANIAGAASGTASATWTAPRREMIDPGKEARAIRDQVRAGTLSLSEAIRQSGQDPAQVLSEIAADNQKLDALGLILDSDPRKRTSSGGDPGTPVLPSTEDKKDEEKDDDAS